MLVRKSLLLPKDHTTSSTWCPTKYNATLDLEVDGDNTMVNLASYSRVLHHGLLLLENIDDVATPQQAAKEQYNIVNFLGGSGPYKQHRGFGIDPNPPAQCHVEHVQLFSRHGERFPSKGDGVRFEGIWDILSKYKQDHGKLNGDLAVFNNYQYFVTNKEYYEKETDRTNAQLPYLGLDDAFQHGQVFRKKYGHLIPKDIKFPVFSLNSGRCFYTGKRFAQAFLDTDDVLNVEFVVVDEDAKMGANSLTPRYACNVDGENKDQINKYDKLYLDRIVERWQVDNPGLNLTGSQVSGMMLWCGFEINVKGWGPTCDLFTTEEWIREQYRGDVGNYYELGRGNKVAPVMGSEMAKASFKLLNDTTAANQVYLSFTHDTDVELMLTALNIIDPEHDIPVDHVPFPNPYLAAEIVPMGARLYIERLNCNGERYVRFILNDAVIPIRSCQSGPGFTCKLSDYQGYLDWQIGNITFNKDCDAHGPGELTFYWDYTSHSYNASLIDQ